MPSKSELLAIAEALEWAHKVQGCGVPARIAELRAQAAQESDEQPVAWVHICSKPGHRMVYATVDPQDNQWWPVDQWTIGHEVHALYLHPSPREVRMEALLREAQQLCHLGDGDTDLHARIRAELEAGK